MKTSPELMLAILAMDAYNEGYGPGLNVAAPGESLAKAIGDATIISDSSTKLDPETTKAAGFFAVAYEWTVKEITKTVISYRGTDNPLGGDPTKKGGSDVLKGWLIGAGLLVPQAGLAEQFYKTITGQTGSYPTNAPNVFLN